MRELVRRTGCGLLLDLNNLYVNANNLGLAPDRYLDDLPADAIGEMHLAGHARRRIGARTVLIDDHGGAVDPAVWRLYEAAVRRFGARPTLIEWDTRIPPLADLLAEAGRAEAILGGEKARDRACDAA